MRNARRLRSAGMSSGKWPATAIKYVNDQPNARSSGLVSGRNFRLGMQLGNCAKTPAVRAAGKTAHADDEFAKIVACGMRTRYPGGMIGLNPVRRIENAKVAIKTGGRRVPHAIFWTGGWYHLIRGEVASVQGKRDNEPTGTA